MCFTVELSRELNKTFLVSMRLGKHPFPSRTRRLRPKRPMVLHWRRCGEQVDARSNGDVAQLGEHLPCKQGVESSNLFISTQKQKLFENGLIAQLVRAHA